MAFDTLRRHLGEHRWAPARMIVLVDDHGADTLIEIVPVSDAGHYAEFRPHARLERPVAATPHLRKRDLQAQRRFGANHRCNFARPAGVAACGCRLGIEPRQYLLDAAGGENPVDGAAVGHYGALLLLLLPLPACGERVGGG